MHDRRRFLLGAAALGFAQALPRRLRAQPRFARDPFPLGVASGYPSPGSVMLWTRLLTDFEAPDGGLGPAPVPVRWEIASDDAMRRIVASGEAAADPAFAHSVHVEAKGLEPDRWYWYRFTAGDAASPVGRTRTTPSFDAAPERLRLLFASCQQYEQGYYAAWRHAAADAPDLVAFLGDYIYESSWGRNHVRKHDPGEPYTLNDYRRRYARYKSDADLRGAHAACPWVLTWDDHEVDNDYAADRSEDGMDRQDFLKRRAAAYRAFYEHQPLPERMRPDGAAMRLHTQLGWGRLARFYLLDDRQYRSWQACPRRRGGASVVDLESCAALVDPSRSMLGREQERWLSRAFERSRSAWNVLAQQTLMARAGSPAGPGRRYWTDGWDGYPVARRRLLEEIAQRRLANPVVLGGDVHYHAVADLKTDFDDPSSPVVASEFCGTSISSQSRAQRHLDAMREANPHIRLADGRGRGYVRVDVAPGRMTADLRVLDDVREQGSGCATLARFVVEDGRPGAQR